MLREQVKDTLFGFEEFTDSWRKSPRGTSSTIHCRKGCSGCCSLAVHATFPEAAAATATLKPLQQKALSCYMERLSAMLPGLTDLKSYLRRHRRDLGPCPFLSESGACGIYEVRPLTCRALLSTRPAEWCSVDFASLDDWDRQAYESGLDRQVVAWPTHYVAATQEAARHRENTLLDTMRQRFGWSLAGNFPLMVWLAHPDRLGRSHLSGQEAADILHALGYRHPLLLELATHATFEAPR